MTTTHPINPRAVVATAWGGMLAVLLTMLILEPLRYAMAGDFAGLSSLLQTDPGAMGLKVLVSLICLNGLVQVSVQMLSCKTSRVAVLILSDLYALFFVVHNVAHFAGGEAFGLQTVLDVTQHLLAGAAVWGSWLWFKANSADVHQQ